MANREPARRGLFKRESATYHKILQEGRVTYQEEQPGDHERQGEQSLVPFRARNQFHASNFHVCWEFA
jgi:hypothetical protein